MFILNILSDLHEIMISNSGFFPIRLIKALFVPSFHITTVYRFGNFCNKLWFPFKFIGMLIYFPFVVIIRLAYNTSVPAACKIGKKFIILHHGSIYINKNTVIGDNVRIAAQVVLGVSKLDDQRCPVIGNRVFIGAGAKVLGAVKIGDNSIIGANAVVVKNIPEYSVACGVPAKVIRQMSKKINKNNVYNNKQNNNPNNNPNNKHQNKNQVKNIENKSPKNQQTTPQITQQTTPENAASNTNKKKRRKKNFGSNVGKIHEDSRKIINNN